MSVLAKSQNTAIRMQATLCDSHGLLFACVLRIRDFSEFASIARFAGQFFDNDSCPEIGARDWQRIRQYIFGIFVHFESQVTRRIFRNAAAVRSPLQCTNQKTDFIQMHQSCVLDRIRSVFGVFVYSILCRGHVQWKTEATDQYAVLVMRNQRTNRLHTCHLPHEKLCHELVGPFRADA